MLGFGRSADAALLDGGDAGGVIGSLGENGVGGMARLEDLKGAGLIVSCFGMVDLNSGVLCLYPCTGDEVRLRPTNACYAVIKECRVDTVRQ